jgi:hypothetical protein
VALLPELAMPEILLKVMQPTMGSAASMQAVLPMFAKVWDMEVAYTR